MQDVNKQQSRKRVCSKGKCIFNFNPIFLMVYQYGGIGTCPNILIISTQRFVCISNNSIDYIVKCSQVATVMEGSPANTCSVQICLAHVWAHK